MRFEDQAKGFRCPQCSGPRRRFAKKVGDKIGVTRDGGDAPILLISFGGLAATIAFAVWAIQNLVRGWVGGGIEEKKAAGMSYCMLGWVGGWR